MLETAMASGICSMGVDVLLVGPMPTPGIAFLTRSLRADAGAVISASHNPFQDNGIKFFSRRGFKLPDEVELKIEQLVLARDIDHLRPTAHEVGKAFRVDDALGRYNVFVKNTFPKHLTLDRLKVVVDCANGAAYKVAPEVLEELGADVTAIGAKPDGQNINLDCGSTHPEAVSAAVREKGADVGISLDGDGDRAILVDEKGNIVDGDAILAMAARELLAKKRLRRNTVVATEMSNLGLDVALEELGGRVVRTPVGDRYVVEEMLRGGFCLGGEQSGHIVFLDHTTTGDGLITALAVLAIMVRKRRPLSELSAVMTRFPQLLVNVPVHSKPDLSRLRSVQEAIGAAESALEGRGRVVVRYSGTEMLARVMIEGQEEKQVRSLADDIAGAIRREIGTQ